ncbi:MAG TPA: hypothetical protein HA283_00360 [Nanoarchaeota archaeon]|nr:hypothetical protein [Nanoarchaeota archaeon]HIH62726.1 hypothetical protein [Nanoarchaeota archaeon]HIJ09931.1 hypothetical protein [Nanoarchaeota archaeon]
MPSEFIYDPSEDYSPQKDNFLTPVYFEKEVLLPFIYNPDYNCTFVSETYGALVFEDNSIPFGINPQGHLIFWLGDINRLTPKIKGILKPYNISSDNNIESEFKQGQLDAEFTDNILEVELFLLLNKINEESQKRFNFKIFNSDIIPLDRLLEICSAYKRITFNNEDDFKRIISDLNEKLIETINRDELTSYLISKQIKVNTDLGDIKKLEILFKEILSDDSNIIASFFYLYDLRIWATHSGGGKKFENVVKLLGLKKDSNFEEIYNCLINQLHGSLESALNKIKKIKKFT